MTDGVHTWDNHDLFVTLVAQTFILLKNHLAVTMSPCPCRDICITYLGLHCQIKMRLVFTSV